MDACFTFEVDALLDVEGIGKMKYETLDSLFKGRKMLMLLGTQ